MLWKEKIQTTSRTRFANQALGSLLKKCMPTASNRSPTHRCIGKDRRQLGQLGDFQPSKLTTLESQLNWETKRDNNPRDTLCMQNGPQGKALLMGSWKQAAFNSLPHRRHRLPIAMRPLSWRRPIRVLIPAIAVTVTATGCSRPRMRLLTRRVQRRKSTPRLTKHPAGPPAALPGSAGNRCAIAPNRRATVHRQGNGPPAALDSFVPGDNACSHCCCGSVSI